MNIHISGAYIMLLAILVTAPCVATAYGEEGHLPPGVQIYRGGDAVVERGFDVITVYTHDAPEKVMAFYRRTLGMEPTEERWFHVGDEDTGELAGIVPVGVRVESASESTERDVEEADFFETLQEEIRRNRMMGSAKYNEGEFRQLKQRYAHLVKGWYPDFDIKEKLENCKDYGDSGYAEQSEVDANRIQALIAQGRQDEAMRLVNKSAQAGMNAQYEGVRVHWDEWVECYKEIDRHDYQTRVLLGLIEGKFTPATQVGRGNRSGQGKKSSGTANELINKGVDKLKGIFGF